MADAINIKVSESGLSLRPVIIIIFSFSLSICVGGFWLLVSTSLSDDLLTDDAQPAV